ncbi:LysR family transcriptional regulator [Gynuella sunshinyii]|uniref:Transcriptional regulator n=1 Tax=Gynuella sunshinyii YC6258 TaxID=1445510 RepID=A0A0C5VQ11_9GAMM|nr:LysR family transcriptional regulator [Gynuella sunshinyii]AJQ92364.1 transcriptional regulator [Gynuella sunshinyii YC6258]
MRKHSGLPKPVSEYDLRLLRIFRVVVECGGFSAAEQVLNISRSTISVHISNLEKRMNVRLARRGRSGFALTEKGKAIYEGSLTLFEALNEFSWLVDSLDEELSGELSILCSDEVALARQLKLPETIAWLNRKAPKLQIALNSDTVPAIEKALLNGTAHVGIMPEFRNIEALEYQPGYEEIFYLCCGARHPLFHRADESIDDAELAACATAHPGIDVNLAGIEQLRGLNLSARAYQFDTRTPLVLSGCYLGFFPMSYIQGFIERGEVRLLQPDKRCYRVNHAFVHRQERVMDAKIELFYQARQAVS